jgi:hypothetical protein
MLGQTGWYNATASDSNGEWVTDPLLVFTFTTRAFYGGIISIQSDTKYNEYPVDYTLRVYKDAALLYTKIVTGNTDIAIQVTMTGLSESEVNKITLEINKWSMPYGIVKIIELGFELSDTFYGDDIISLEILEETEVEEGSVPLGNISANEISVVLSNDGNRFNYGNPNSVYNGVIKKDRKIEVWLGFVLPASSADITTGDYIVEVTDGVKVGYLPYGVYWSDEWVTDEQTRTVSTFARDRMDSLRQLVYDDSLLYTNITLSSLAEKLMASANVKVTDTMDWVIDKSLDDITIPFGYSDKKTYFEALKDIAIVGLTTVYVDRTGKVIIGSYPVSRNDSPVPEASWTQNVVYNQTVSPKTEEIANSIEVKAKYLVLTSSAVSVYESDDQYTIPTGASSLDISLAWDDVPVDPTTVIVTLTNVSGTSIISVSDIYVWGGRFTITGSAGNVFSLDAVGIAALPQSEILYSVHDQKSITAYGKRVYEFPANSLLQKYSTAKQIADGLLPSYKEPRKDAAVSLPADTIVALSDPIVLTEYKDSETETKTYFHIIRQTLTYDGALDAEVELRRFLT